MQNLGSIAHGGIPSFLADRMVGKLARWLRLLGYDAAYLPQLSPQGVMREARRQGRIILTRDTRIPRYKDAPPFIFIASDRFREQLKQVVEELRLDVETYALTRCSECNVALEPIPKAQVRDRVPAYVWETQEEFRRCPACRRIYWGATHKRHVREELQKLGLINAK